MKVQYLPTPNTYEMMHTPLVIILHTTGGSFHSAVSWLRMSPGERERRYGKKTYSSAHAVFGRSGAIAELAGVHLGTWHAGEQHEPSEWALKTLKKDTTGRIINPNRQSIGLEFEANYDVNRDGAIEKSETLYTQKQVEACAWYIINEIEPKIKEHYGIEHQFTHKYIGTHHDIMSQKPNLKIQREMVIAELKKQRNAQRDKNDREQLTVKVGTILKVEQVGLNTLVIKKA